MPPDLVSIIIAAHDNWPDLELTIQSALHQSHEPIEVIVVDNDSSDATQKEVPQRFGDAVRYIRQANRGDAGAYNTGMGAATGEFMQFLDGDDFLAPNKIEKQIAAFRADPEAEIVFGDTRQFQSMAGKADWTDIDTRDYDDMLAAFLDPDGNGAGLMVQGALFRRSTLERVGAWDESLYVADIDYWFRATWARCRFRYCPGSLWFYRIHPGQMSANQAAIARGLEAAWEKALGYITDEPYRSSLTMQLARFSWHQAILREDTTTRERLARLAWARQLNREAISLIAYLAGCGLIILPGGRLLARAPRLRWLRRGMTRLLGIR